MRIFKTLSWLHMVRENTETLRTLKIKNTVEEIRARTISRGS
jgi:hypothetical protein